MTTKRDTNEFTRNEFAVLRAFAELKKPSQRDIAAAAKLSLQTVNTACKKLATQGIVAEGALTKQGKRALAPYRINNAIIMAAGLSSRFAPISYEQSKGMLKVRGEILVERQIRQLQEAGITDITIVVGYKKEYYHYLKKKFGVNLVINPEFASRNNNSTLYCVRERLKNTYICSVDNYFVHNPFHAYEYTACYSAEQRTRSKTEWALTLGRAGRITSVTIGGKKAWYMLGYAYFDKAFSKQFTKILEAEYALPETADKLWEQIFVEHINELPMYVIKHNGGDIFEFDSLDEVRKFDPAFLDNLDSSILDNIVSVLGCDKTEIRDIWPIKQGLTNLSCHFATDSGEYVYRYPGVGTEKMIDRPTEVKAQLKAKELGLDDTFIYEDEKTGWKLSHYITNCRLLDAHDPAQVKKAMKLARRLHECGAQFSRTFDYYKEGKKYEKLLAEKGAIDVPGYDELAKQAKTVRKLAGADKAPTCLTHNDFFSLNLLLDEKDKLYLIDWEYAGMADYASDFGTFVVTCKISEEEALQALSFYFGRKPTAAEIRHNFAYVGLAAWCWYVWALLKEAEGDYVGEWLYTYCDYATQYLPKTIELYNAAEKD